MDEAREVLDRIERIEELERGGAPAAALLAELRALVREAESWAARDRAGERAERAISRCREALSGG